jgi:hypothetical protein
MKTVKMLSIVSVLFVAACSHMFGPSLYDSLDVDDERTLCCECMASYSCFTEGSVSCYRGDNPTSRFTVNAECVDEGGSCYAECGEWFAE